MYAYDKPETQSPGKDVTPDAKPEQATPLDEAKAMEWPHETGDENAQPIWSPC